MKLRIAPVNGEILVKRLAARIKYLNTSMLDQNQLLIGISVLLSFFVGYKYGLKISRKGENFIKLTNTRGSDASKFPDDECDSPGGSSKTAKGQSQSAPRGEYKMVLVVRNDLKMGKGKFIKIS